MFTKIQDPDHFTTFYEDNSLLIQFIVVEFLHIHQLTFQIKTLIENQLNFTLDLDLNRFIPLLREMLAQLVGHHLPQQEKISLSHLSHWTKGSLTKFKEYCERFSHNSYHQNRKHVHLHMAAHQVWLAAIEHMELLNSLQRNPYLQNVNTVLGVQPIKRTFQTLQTRFNQVSRTIPRVISAYWDNENVVLCLLRKRNQLTEIYGSDFLYKRFKWPMKMKEIFQLLRKRYQDRGFEGLLPTIHQICDLEEDLHGAS